MTRYDDENIRKKLDEVVGTSYDSIFSKGAVKRRVVKGLLAAAGALIAVCVIVLVIESHRLPSETARPIAKKPVPVQIVPESKPRP